MSESVDDSQSNSGDELPEDLDITALVGPYTFPDIKRRRIAGSIYGVLALGCAVIWIAGGALGFALGFVGLALIAIHHWATAWPLKIDQTQALATASNTAGFPIGHSSAQLGWRGWLSKPSWRVLLYSADEPPSMRGLVEIDATEGQVLGSYTEENPEDWSEYDFGDQ